MAAKVFVVMTCILLPAVAFTTYGPVWPSTLAAAILSILVNIAAFALCQSFEDKQHFKRRLILFGVLSFVSFFAFAALYSAFTVALNLPYGHLRVQAGYRHTDEIRRFLTEQQSKGARSMSSSDLLFMSAINPDSIWTPLSTAVTGAATLSSWLILSFGIASIATLISKLFPNGEVLEKQREIERATELVKQEPDRNRAVWDLARLRLELYFDRNLTQISAIFWLSVVVMLSGFGLIVFSINRALNAPGTVQSVSLISAASGIITEFVGATFLFLYRSTIQQAASNIRTLERINSVGMAVAILDTISPASANLSDQTKSSVVKALIRTDYFREAETRRPHQELCEDDSVMPSRRGRC